MTDDHVLRGRRYRPSRSRDIHFPSLFPSFWGAGFECSTHVDKAGRQDLVRLTQHDRHLCEDYARIEALGLTTAREGVPWYRIDRGGTYDFGQVAGYVEAARQFGLTVIWDLFHYGYPDDLDPFSDVFIERFARYCGAFAQYLIESSGDDGDDDGDNDAREGARFYTVVNEPSFFAWASGEVGIFAPFVHGRGFDLKLRLARACIAGTDAIRAVDPKARFLNVDPVVHTVPPLDAPELAEDSERFNEFQWQFWDIVAGRVHPELGGSPAHLDVIGVNHYMHGQWEHCRDGWLGFDDPRRKPLAELLADVAARYPGHPIFVSETACRGDMRAVWLDYTVDQAMEALKRGVDLQGVCLYPIVDMPDWYSGEWIEYGMWDLVLDAKTGAMRRRLYRPYREALWRGQRRIEESGLVAKDGESGVVARAA